VDCGIKNVYYVIEMWIAVFKMWIAVFKMWITVLKSPGF
jgi:hypothetical protein